MRKQIFIFVFIFLLIGFVGAFFHSDSVCGDGIETGNCSSIKPYFCSEGVLVENVTECGCPENFNLIGGECVSEYKQNSKNITLKYTLDGKENEFNFTVYEEVVDYLYSLPKGITYYNDEIPERIDFKLKNLDEEKQRDFLLPLVVAIQNLDDDKDNQARIAISIVQKLEFGYSGNLINTPVGSINYTRYPYETLYDMQGVCGEKSELLAFILRELGYGVVFFYHQIENHESIGIKCPEEYGIANTSYCFVETTGPSILTNNENIYLNGLKLNSEPEVIPISEGESLGKDFKEYKDAKLEIKINKIIEEKGKLNPFRYLQYKVLERRYGL